MANGNKAAKVSILGSYVYKNSQVDKIKIDNLNDSHAIMKGSIYIPNIKNLQDGLLSKMKTNTSNGVVIEYYTDVFIDTDQKTFDIGDNPLTLIEFDDKINGTQTIGSYIGDHLNSTNDVYTHDPDPSLYGLCFPYKSYTYPIGQAKLTAKYSFYQNSNNGFIYGRGVSGYVDNLPNLIRKNILGSIEFIKPRMDKTNDRYLIPKYIPSCNDDFMELTEIIGSNLYKKGIGFISCLNLPFDSKYPDNRRYRMTFSQITDTHGNRKDSYGFSAFLRNNSSKPRTQRLIVGDGNGNLYSIAGYNTQTIESYYSWGYSFGFLTDDDGEKYILIYMNSPSHTNNGVSYYGANNIEIMPIKELRGYKLDSNLKTVGGLIRIQDNFDVVGLIDSLLGDIVDPEDLGAPDAYGPGNPYQNTNNAGSSIGGNFNFDDVIEINDAPPNTGFDTFDYQTSLFGTYVMSNKNIKDYTHTIESYYSWGYSFGFLTDDDGEKYILIYMNSPSHTNNGVSYYGANNIEIMPIKELRGYKLDSNLKTVGGLIRIQDNFDVVGLIDSLLGDIVDPEDLGAPDAYGPGNPYQNTNNAGSSIGGNFNFDDVIEINDAPPNTGFDTFDYQTSLFGTYVMSNKNIKDYTHTLNLLYEHSSDILFGSAASAMAGRIVEGTTGLLSLPITIPSTNYANTTFSIGNTGIADENATYAELSNGNFTTANYLTKNMIEYTINIDPIKHRYDNFLDFPPYSSASIYIPYIGTQELPLGLIQSTSQYTNTLKLKVRVDVPTGDFVVILFSNGVPITHWNGNCARTIQLAVNDNSQIIRNVSNQISRAAGAIGMGAMTGGVIGSASQLVQTIAEEGIQSQTPISTTQHKIGNIQNSGVSGWMDNQQFYIIVERPVMYLPYKYGHHIGYPTDKVVRIGSCKGFCQFGELHLECSANQAEKDEITRVLQEGVILNVS